ncbi:TRAM domain-containing protein [Candidatus Curtissbacteria bacterium]|nr:TRAM domain-containing protein [Candidatus Curtissbacteria bacterium]
MPKFLIPRNKFLWFLLTRVLGMAVLLSFGGYLAKPGVWPDFPFDPPIFAEIISAFVFGAIGFFLPDLIVIGTKSGFTRIMDMIAVRVSASVVNSLPKRKVGKKKKVKHESDWVLVDTSALMDSRLIRVVESGFLRGTLVISKTILTELRHLADSKENSKREKGRRALSDLAKLKDFKSIKVKFIDGFTQKEADGGLIEFASINKLPLLTVDFNLLKEAEARGISVMSFNTLSNAIKIDALPGDNLDIKVTQVGSVKGQGVGFLSDGTMVVIENGENLIGKTVKVEVNKAIQKDTGRIIFGSVA